MREFSKIIYKYLKVFIIVLISLFILMILTSLIPSSVMRKNVQESADYMMDLGEYHYINIKMLKGVNKFIYTDALMVNTAYSIDNKNPIKSFLLAKKNFIPGITKIIHTNTPKGVPTAEKYLNDKYPESIRYQIIELYDMSHSEEVYESFEYARYWHGYLIFLRPLLVLFNYQQLEILFSAVTIVLALYLLYLVYKRFNIFVALSFLVGMLAMDIFIISSCINAIVCFQIAFIFSIYLLRKKNLQIEKIPLLFFIIGILTNFIDFLTNPIVTLGIPAIICFLIMREKKVKLKEMYLIILNSIITWGAGYGLTWVSKWIITDILYNRGVVMNAIKQALVRTGLANEEAVTIEKLYCRIERYEGIYCKSIISLINCIYFGIYVLKFYKKEDKLLKNVKEVGPLIVIILLPIVWGMALINHTTVHAFFTYRNNIILIIGIQLAVLIFCNMCDKNIKNTGDKNE